MDTRTADILLFGDFHLDRGGGGLFRQLEGGICERLTIGSRALELLDLLIDRRGALVTKRELMEAVWPGTAVEENNLAQQIATLRRLLDQGRAEGSCIQTVPGRGYRFAAEVTRIEPHSSAASPEVSTGKVGLVAESWRGSRSPVWRRSWTGLAATIAGAALLVAAMTAWNWHSVWPRPSVPRLSIVVLPFTNLGDDKTNLSDDKEQQYFADGVTEDLTTDLSRILDSFVISAGTAFTYKDKRANAKEIGQELGVRYVLEGSVQRSGQQVRVNAQLIDAESDAHVWAERFERDLGDLFALQNEITGQIAATLSLELVSAEAARPTVDPDAMDYIFRGRAASNKGPGREGFAEAISYFERALELAPGSAEAQSWLAGALSGRVMNQLADSPAADLKRAEKLIAQALATSPRSLLAHSAKAAWLKAQGRCEEAISEYEMVIAHNRNSVSALANLGQCKIFTGAIEEGIALEERVLRLSPRDPFNGNRYWAIGFARLLQSRTDDAIVWLEKGRDLSPGGPYTHARLAAAYALKGEAERAADELAEARRLTRDDQYSSIARLKAEPSFARLPQVVLALYETTYFAGLRKAGVPNE